MSARFEIVRTDAEQPWHARFRAANGRIVWTTENYAEERAARRAVLLIARACGWTLALDSPAIREVDERVTT